MVAGVRIELLFLIPNEACNRYTAPAIYYGSSGQNRTDDLPGMNRSL